MLPRDAVCSARYTPCREGPGIPHVSVCEHAVAWRTHLMRCRSAALSPTAGLRYIHTALSEDNRQHCTAELTVSQHIMPIAGDSSAEYSTPGCPGRDAVLKCSSAANHGSLQLCPLRDLVCTGNMSDRDCKVRLCTTPAAAVLPPCFVVLAPVVHMWSL